MAGTPEGAFHLFKFREWFLSPSRLPTAITVVVTGITLSSAENFYSLGQFSQAYCVL
jgi:hypothetical protein